MPGRVVRFQDFVVSLGENFPLLDDHGAEWAAITACDAAVSFAERDLHERGILSSHDVSDVSSAYRAQAAPRQERRRVPPSSFSPCVLNTLQEPFTVAQRQDARVKTERLNVSAREPARRFAAPQFAARRSR